MQQVPLFIDTEDKVAGPFTWRQLLWLGAIIVILVILWQLLDESAFYVVAVPLILVALAFMFYRPQGVPLVNYVGYALRYFFRPRTYLWQREFRKESHSSKKQPVEEIPIVKKDLSVGDILSLTETLDSHGEKSNERLEKLISQRASSTKKQKRRFSKRK